VRRICVCFLVAEAEAFDNGIRIYLKRVSAEPPEKKGESIRSNEEAFRIGKWAEHGHSSRTRVGAHT
jgi:hypothetical protein